MDTDEAVDQALDIGAHLGAAALVLIVGNTLAVVARRYTHRLLARPKIASALGPSTEQLLRSAVFYIILALAVAASLIALGVSGTTVTTVIIVLIALIGLALQQSLANFAATVIFLTEGIRFALPQRDVHLLTKPDPVEIGDWGKPNLGSNQAPSS